MAGKAKTAAKGSAAGKGPNDHGFKHEPANTVLELRFVVNSKGNLAPKLRFVRT